MADVMPHKNEEGLNVIARSDDVDDARRPLFLRDWWFDHLHADCLAGQRRHVIDGHSGSTQCRLQLIERVPGQFAALANWYSFRWQPQLSGGDDVSQLAAMTSAFAAARACAHRLTLSPVPAEGGVADAMATALRRAGWTISVAAVSSSHWLDPNGRSFADWWAARPGQLRSTVQRKAKRGIVSWSIHDVFSDALWDEFAAVYAASWKPAESHPEFLRGWARAAAAAGALRLGIARIDGRAVAGQFWTFDAGTAHIHKLAQVSDKNVEAHSPGTLLSYALFAHAFDVDRAARIDFGTGTDGYKRDWMEESADLVTIIAVDLRQPRGWWSLARDGLSRVAGRLHKS